MRRVEIAAKKPRHALQARPYQVEIAKIAQKESIIAKLNTGLGKTFIAVMVIKHHLPETFKSVSEGGRRVLFVVKTGNSGFYRVLVALVHLVYQQAEFLRSQLPLNPNDIGIFHGQVSPTVWIDEWTKSVWQGQLEKHRVLVMTAGVLRDILNHGKLSLRNICLLIFDECHHADPDSKSDYTDICQHLHSFPRGRWLPDYSRGPKVLGLSASLVNNTKVGENLDTKIRRLEQLMRARVVTSTDSSINDVTGIRQCIPIRYQLGGSSILPGQRYHEFVQKLQNGIKTLERLLPSLSVRDDYIDLEALLDSNKQIRKEVFLSIMELHEFSPKKLKRLLMQCLRVTEEFGVFCGAHACEQTEKALQTLLQCGSSSRVNNPECIRVIQACLKAISEALEVFKSIRQASVRKLGLPPQNDPNNSLWDYAAPAVTPYLPGWYSFPSPRG
ncbi:unnamed protein product [Rodentolepis nana]|uniref:Helicase ATP-binding domain-containing protein n=1 Tax=Rodentolepis nana TaxID=102285 RepID=A0A0R3TY58_RODNA|nr:unnamed protein product [Rodentolepis nana]